MRLLISGCLLFATACGRGEYVYHVPPATADGLRVADARELGIDTGRIGAIVRPFREGRRGKHLSLLVMKDGRLIVEEYFGKAKRDKRHGVQSVSKSITSLLVGYALQQHFIQSIDDPITKYLPAYRHLLTGGREKITIRHLLTMTPGLEWDEWSTAYGEADNIRARERRSRDAIAFVLGQPLASQPGETFSYNGGGMTVLGEILKNASGMSPEQLVERAFRGLLSRDEIEPTLQDEGHWNAAGGFMVTPRGMAKIGQMVLDGGTWNGDTVIDRRWIAESTSGYIGRGGTGYGYLWWRHRLSVGGDRVEAIEANGIGDQRIVIVPALGLVIVTTAENFGKETSLATLLERSVLESLAPRAAARTPRPDTPIDSALAFPPPQVRWAEVVLEGGVHVWVDTATDKRLDDGSYLIWIRTELEKQNFEAGKPFNRFITRFLLRCETRTDGRFKRVSTTGFLDDGPPVFQDVVGLDAARAQPWVPAWAGSADLMLDRRACDALRWARDDT